ncbi:E1 protein [Vulpes vulpes papillomavirus 1]|uniref:Replication protein E1 n=1 Tax=Vulpes vulpes papillomavirus 1 TaxID=1163709 RepID=A0A0A7BW90_9PAPI|nr:E1 protein [Vulpes vulpes papillomavirus 1]AHM27268.1 E1 protein [Vulpes vulpes papillomavirus 1]
MGDKGTDSSSSIEEGCSGWYLVTEAECKDDLNDLEALFDGSTDGSDISQLIDDRDEVDQGNSLALFNQQLLEDNEQQLVDLKRKYLTPSPKQTSIVDLSPQLESVSISSSARNSKRRLFQDSGIGNETEDILSEVVQVQNTSSDVSDTEAVQNGTVVVPNGDAFCLDLLRSSNKRACALAKFKKEFGISFTELTRTYKSDKTCCTSWVCVAFLVGEELVAAAKTLLQQHCEYFQIVQPTVAPIVTVLLLLECKSAKSRETLFKLLASMLPPPPNVSEVQLMADPPKIRSLPTALYFYKNSLSNISFKHGSWPDWLAKQVLVSHQSASETFDFGTMVQWAYDNELFDEPEIAYNYATFAEVDPNAAAWLKSNSQLKFVKDCASMVKLYKRQEMRNMSMPQWIDRCCSKVQEEGDWKSIAKFLKYQGINLLEFLGALRMFFKGIPKKNCLAIHGPPDTGKSYFCYSLISFLEGRVISFMNSRSQFWLQPLMDTKIGFLDDATSACWDYMDVYMRNALDGNKICLDSKHRAPMQIKLPPLLVTTNVDVKGEAMYRYLHSRVTTFKFPNPLPLNDSGEPVYQFTHCTWKSFFTKLRKQLDLECIEEEGDGDSQRTFRCSAGTASDSL